MPAASSRMPALFIGHGSPALLLEPNGFTPAWREAAQNMPRPSAVLCISAHWESMDSAATAASMPHIAAAWRSKSIRQCSAQAARPSRHQRAATLSGDGTMNGA